MTELQNGLDWWDRSNMTAIPQQQQQRHPSAVQQQQQQQSSPLTRYSNSQNTPYYQPLPPPPSAANNLSSPAISNTDLPVLHDSAVKPSLSHSRVSPSNSGRRSFQHNRRSSDLSGIREHPYANVNPQPSPSPTASTERSNTSSRKNSAVIKQGEMHVEKNTEGKPPYSYAMLIRYAIENSPNKKLTLSEIYIWVTEHYPFYNTAGNGWKVRGEDLGNGRERGSGHQSQASQSKARQGKARQQKEFFFSCQKYMVTIFKILLPHNSLWLEWNGVEWSEVGWAGLGCIIDSFLI